MAVTDITNCRFGKLLVLERCGSDNFSRALWLCKCDCGNTKIVRGNHLIQGGTTSCGCVVKEMNKARTVYKGKKNPHHKRLHSIWRSMKLRCYYEKHNSYKYYGGRGISICEEWRNNFNVFCDWALGNGYADDLTIDRIDVNGNYEPSNCRWATWAEQGKNKRNTPKSCKIK